uniref:Uncharacterized protein n=1 Tax=Arundo donax TaxID=35708 RepID=A0A0A9H267_ARUDO
MTSGKVQQYINKLIPRQNNWTNTHGQTKEKLG